MRAAVLLLLVGAASSFVEKSEWNAFKVKHAKSYANPIEEFYRMKVISGWRTSSIEIVSHFVVHSTA